MTPAYDVAIIIPTYNEAENIAELLRRIFGVVRENGWRAQVVVVDDSSPDGTARTVRRESATYGEALRLIERSGKRGLSLSVLEGIRDTDAGVVVVMDADLSHPPEALPALLAPIRSGAARFVVGSRYAAGGCTEDWGLLPFLRSKIAGALARPLTTIGDPMAGFFAFSREILRPDVKLDALGYKISLEILVKTGCREVAEVPITYRGRRRGKSKLGVGVQLAYLHHLFRLYAHVASRRWSSN